MNWDARAQQLRARGLDNAHASIAPDTSASVGSFSASSVVAEARRFIGGNPTGRSRLWCARFMLLPLAAVAFGLTAIGIVLLLVEPTVG